MGRPSKFDRDQAVDSVMQEIWDKGYEASSAKALSEHLGITRSSFYNALGSREALFGEVLRRYTAQAPDRALFGDDDRSVARLLTDTMREICRVRAADPAARGCLAVNCIAELVGVNPALGPLLEQAVAAKLDRLEELLRLAVARGEIEDRSDLRDKALALQNLLIGLNVMAKVVRSETELWAAARQTLAGLDLLAE